MKSRQNSHSTIAKIMHIVVWLLLFILLSYFFASWQAKQVRPNQTVTANQQSSFIEVILKPNRQHHYVFPGKINGEEVEFFVDTGATDVSVPAELEKALQLSRSYPAQARTANGIVTVYLTRIKQLEIGPILLENIRASINPGMQGKQVLLGMSALRHLEFFQRDGNLVLRQKR